MANDDIPIASAAAFTPTAAPLKKFESKILTLDQEFGKTAADRGGDSPAPEAPVPMTPAAAPLDRLAALRDLARKLRSAPDADHTLQEVVDEACRCTRSDAAVLSLSAPLSRQFVCGSALGAGPYISVPLRAGGPSFGELVLTRLAERADYEADDETFAELIAEYVAKAISTLRAGAVIPQEAQDFIDQISGDLRAPLAGATATVGTVVAENDGLSADTLTYLTAAQGDLRRMLHSLDGLIMLAHLRQPKPTDMATIPVGPWLAGAVERMQPAAAARNVHVTFREPPEAYLVTGIAAQLDTVADELLSNAIKFTDPGGRVDVTAGVMEGHVRVSVRDNGVGFDPNEAHRMTDCFVRSLTAEAGRYPGLGVGLFLAHQIVAFHGGRLWLEAKRDEGTHAQVLLPQRHAGV